MASLRKKGDAWHVLWRENGRQHSKKVGPKKLAQAIKSEVEARLVRGDLLGIKHRPEVAFDDYCKIYQKDHGHNQAPSTQLREDYAIRCHLKPFFCNTLLSQIEPSDIERYKASRRQKVRPSTVNKELVILKTMFNRAVDWGYLEYSPAARIKKYTEPERETKYLTREELWQVLDAARGQMKAFIAVGAMAGLRKGEMFALKWDDVDLINRRLRVNEHSKGRRYRYIPINQDLFDILSSHPHHIKSPFVFHNPDGTPWHDIRAGFRRAFKDAGMKAPRPHDLRHTFITLLLSEGVDIRTVQELAGHRDIRTTQRYAHTLKRKLLSGVEVLSRPDRAPAGQQAGNNP